MDLPDVSHAPEVASEAAPEADTPSCQGCRRRKLRCSRERPICSHCRRLDSPCVYDLKKNKPGIKAGAVGSLSRRVEALENALLEKSEERNCCNHAHADNPSPSSGSHDVVGILSMLAGELHKLNSKPKTMSQPRSFEALRDHAVVSPTASQTSSRQTGERHDGASHANQARKRRRVDSCGNPNVDLVLPLEENLENITTSLPPADLLEDIINAYFDVIQPWIPIIHETQFRRRVQEQDQLPQLVVVLHAMVVAALRFVNNTERKLAPEEIERWTARSRRFVVLISMGGLSVENLQALIIVAFDDIGNGEASKAWSIIGSLTRTVEYLQLSIESDHHSSEPLLKPLPTIAGPKDWTEEEQRRRVFWNIFCLDRFCSVTTGWNTSLTSDDVQRRLPADGGLWHKEEGVTTPYFGIWDRSVAKIGHSIAFMPGNYPSPEQTQDAVSATPARPGAQARSNTMDMTTVGAFAYRIEATESLSRITTYFLQQKIDFQDRQQVSDWLTRFKELDLRLVHWKMFLPQRWRDSNISRQPALINMDPNLTLAHVTHNTSMILLHQRIAYPDPLWSDSFKLPSFCSAETCQVAAVETTTITQKYLKYTPEYSPVTNQYAFCVFISARVLLVHWRHYKADLAPEFWILVGALDEMAKRWAGPVLTHAAARSLAGKYAEQLRLLHSRCESDPHVFIDVLGYSSGMVQGTPSSPFFPSAAQQPVHRSQAGNVNYENHTTGPEPLSVGGPAPDIQPGPSGMDPIQPPIQQSGLTPSADIHPDKLSAISHMLMEEDFMAMDRIISLDDMIFTAPEISSSALTWGNGNGQVE